MFEGNGEARALFLLNFFVALAVVALLSVHFYEITLSVKKGNEAHQALCVIEQNSERRLKALDVLLDDSSLTENTRVYYERSRVILVQQLNDLDFLDCIGSSPGG